MLLILDLIIILRNLNSRIKNLIRYVLLESWKPTAQKASEALRYSSISDGAIPYYINKIYLIISLIVGWKFLQQFNLKLPEILFYFCVRNVISISQKRSISKVLNFKVDSYRLEGNPQSLNQPTEIEIYFMYFKIVQKITMRSGTYCSNWTRKNKHCINKCGKSQQITVNKCGKRQQITVWKRSILIFEF